VALALLGLAGARFGAVRPTNFIGSDEWLYVSLLSRAIVSSPYSNRPLNFVWGLPARWLFPDRLYGFLVFHALWIGLAGVLVFLVLRRLLKGTMVPAFLAGAFTIVWAPSDSTRLVPAHMFIYSGCTFGVLLAVWLALEAWARRRVVPAVAALLVLLAQGRAWPLDLTFRHAVAYLCEGRAVGHVPDADHAPRTRILPGPRSPRIEILLDR
jgi:hypothetical protein